ncbi:hypothetical protein TWF751_000271 [Orbilia oligospora]|nr:hypothetical protein TWF751_000271 [Orbilia oligospora]
MRDDVTDVSRMKRGKWLENRRGGNRQDITGFVKVDASMFGIREERIIAKTWLSMYLRAGIRTLEEQIDGFLRNPDTAKAKTTHKTIFETLVEGDSEIKLSKRALVGDSMVLIGAGTETTATTLAEAMYRACIYPELQARLHEELVKAFPNKTDEVTLAKAEKVQYIVAFLKETLRIAAPIPGRIARQTPIEGAMCKETFLPGRTVVSMSIHLMHMNAEIYPNPHKFDPERWMNSDPASLQEKYFVPFSKGSRGCIGTK